MARRRLHRQTVAAYWLRRLLRWRLPTEDLVVEATPVAMHNEYPNDWKWWGGVVALTGGRFTGSDASQPAITNTSAGC